ncbi:MAG: hypothetical protein O2931_16635 [Planctomycetota bacterium]|nr:hypothetical protein [Planctomycetota bacterium]MDA1180408.1 hypothetical protein [Planctomycetota bacterium]
MPKSVIHPSAKIREGFTAHYLETVDDQRLVGFVVDQDPQVVVMRDTEGHHMTGSRGAS